MTLRRRRDVLCRELVEMVDDYLAGELTADDRVAVEQHLAVCDDCRGYVQQVRRMLDLTADLKQGDEVPQGLLDDVLASYRKRR